MPQRTNTTHLTSFIRQPPDAVTYDVSTPDVVTIILPSRSTWTSGLHWHETHTEFLQVVRGHILVTLGHSTKEHSAASGVIEVPKGTVHEWRRVPDDPNGGEDVVVREWTLPEDGRKEVFFRMLNSFLLEEQPQKLYSPLPVVGTWSEDLVERWVVDIQLFVIFKACDNFPVLVGSGAGLVTWLVTHVVLLLAEWVGWLIGLRAIYAEYVGQGLRRRIAR